jgi:hypothetical protein
LTSDPKHYQIPLRAAAATLPFDQEIQTALHAWLTALPQALEAEDTPLGPFSAALAGSRDRLTWQVSAPAEPFTLRLDRYLADFPIPEENLDYLQAVLDDQQPQQAGSWIIARPQIFEPGWFIYPPSGQLSKIRRLLPISDDLYRLLTWSKNNRVDQCLRVGRSLIGSDGFTELVLRISANSAASALEAGMALFDALDLPDPGEEAYQVLQTNQEPELLVSLWLTAKGAAKAGLIMTEPDTDMTLHLLDAVGQTDDDALALFEGVLDKDGPDALEYQQLAGGESAELHYDIY